MYDFSKQLTTNIKNDIITLGKNIDMVRSKRNHHMKELLLILFCCFSYSALSQINSYTYELTNCYYENAIMHDAGNGALLVVGKCNKDFHSVALIDSNMQEKWVLILSRENQAISYGLQSAFIAETQNDSIVTLGLNYSSNLTLEFSFTFLNINLDGQILNQKSYTSQALARLTDLTFDPWHNHYYASTINSNGNSSILKIDPSLDITNTYGHSQGQGPILKIDQILIESDSTVLVVGNTSGAFDIITSVFISKLDSLCGLVNLNTFSAINDESPPALYYDETYGYYLTYSVKNENTAGIIKLTENMEPIRSVNFNFTPSEFELFQRNDLIFVSDSSMIMCSGLSMFDIHPDLQKFNEIYTGNFEGFIQGINLQNGEYRILSMLGLLPAKSYDDSNFCIRKGSLGLNDSANCLFQDWDIDLDSLALSTEILEFQSVNHEFSLVPDSLIVASQKYIIHNRCFEVASNTLENQLEDQVHIFPNPSSDELTIHSDEKSIEGYTVYSSLGACVTDQYGILKSVQHLDCSTWSNGIYYILVQTQDESIMKKQVISHR